MNDIIELIKPTMILCEEDLADLIDEYLFLRDEPLRVADLAFMEDGSIIVELTDVVDEVRENAEAG